jgi:tRNA A37 methylthiotransferase MiaB
MPKYEHKLEMSFVIEHGEKEPLNCPDYIIANEIYKRLVEMAEAGLKNTDIEICHSDTREIEEFSEPLWQNAGLVVPIQRGCDTCGYCTCENIPSPW